MAAYGEFVHKMQSERVTIEVGQDENKKQYKIPKGYLCDNSEWFAKALEDGRFKEGTTNTIALPEDTSAAFEAFFYYIYTGTIKIANSDDDASRDKEILECLDIWTFADKYMLSGLQNSAMMALCELFNAGGRERAQIDSAVLAACFRASEQSPLRTLVAKYVVDRISALGSDFEVDAELGTAQGFLAALHAAELTLRDLGPNDFPRSKKPAKYKTVFATVKYPKKEDPEEEAYFLSNEWSEDPYEYLCFVCGHYWQGDGASAFCKKCNQSHKKCQCSGPRMQLVCQECTKSS